MDFAAHHSHIVMYGFALNLTHESRKGFVRQAT